MASGWNLWVWLECIGVVSVCCGREVYIINIIFPYIATPLLLVLFFWQQHCYFFVHFLISVFSFFI